MTVAILQRFPAVRHHEAGLVLKFADVLQYLCEDDVDWRAVVDASAAAGADWVVVEHETYGVAPMECIRRDLANLRLRFRGRIAPFALPAHAIATFRW